MILYFTGTGNSKFIAEALSDYINDTDIVSLNDVLKNSLSLKFVSQKPFILVVPIHAWSLPNIIPPLFKKAEFSGSRKFYVVVTMAGESGLCSSLCKKCCRAKNLEFMGVGSIEMPSNYILIDSNYTLEDIHHIRTLSVHKAAEIGYNIVHGLCLKPKERNFFPFIKTVLVHSLFVKFIVYSKQFRVSYRCHGCGLCESFCPMNNIHLVDDKPVFGSNCANCFGCINRCPEHAINIPNKTEHHHRYVCIDYKKEKFLRNFSIRSFD